MKRKLLDEIDVGWMPDKVTGSNQRRKEWKEQRQKYGFDNRELWNLDRTFYLWLYERLKRYKEVASEIIDLEYHKFKFKGKEYTQIGIIDEIIKRLEFYFKNDVTDFTEEQKESVNDIAFLWATVLPARWY